jgi:hypothetical protein
MGLRTGLLLLLLLQSAVTQAQALNRNSEEAMQRFKTELFPVCVRDLKKEVPPLEALSGQQLGNICQCAVSRTSQFVAAHSERDGAVVFNRLFLDFLRCDKKTIQTALSENYQARGLKVKDQSFEISPAAGDCLARNEYGIYVQALARKTQPSRKQWEAKLMNCVRLK